MTMRYTTRQVAEFIGVETWRIQRLYELGCVPEPDRFAGKRVIPPAHVVYLVHALQERGWLSTANPSAHHSDSAERQRESGNG